MLILVHFFQVLFRALRDSECKIKCKSRKTRIMCGSDGVSYLSKCEIKRARRCEGKNVSIKKKGKCSGKHIYKVNVFVLFMSRSVISGPLCGNHHFHSTNSKDPSQLRMRIQKKDQGQPVWAIDLVHSSNAVIKHDNLGYASRYEDEFGSSVIDIFPPQGTSHFSNISHFCLIRS